jgi:hypothetical protein
LKVWPCEHAKDDYRDLKDLDHEARGQKTPIKGQKTKEPNEYIQGMKDSIRCLLDLDLRLRIQEEEAPASC